MQSSFYVSISGQVALEKRLETVANNFANVSTTGFRAEDVKFDSIVAQLAPDPVAFSNARGTYLVRKPGALVQTGHLLDVGIQGDGWLAIQTGAGVVYTRDGRMKMLDTGEIVTIDGHPVLDAGGSPLTLNPLYNDVQIGQNGAITQNKQPAGTIGLFKIPDDANLTRFENSGVIPDKAAEPVVDFATEGVMQGFVEESNVNPMYEMTRLLLVQRNFEAVCNSLSTSEATYLEGIKTLGTFS